MMKMVFVDFVTGSEVAADFFMIDDEEVDFAMLLLCHPKYCDRASRDSFNGHCSCLLAVGEIVLDLFLFC